MKKYQKPATAIVAIKTHSLMINVSATEAASGTAAMSRGGGRNSSWDDDEE